MILILTESLILEVGIALSVLVSATLSPRLQGAVIEMLHCENQLKDFPDNSSRPCTTWL